MDFSAGKKARALICLALALATTGVYWRVGGFDFVNLDDPDYVTENKMVSAGLTPGGVIWAFTHFHAGNWHPLTWISHMLDCQFFGLNPGAHHAVNLAFHTANALLLFLLLDRLTGAQWRSAMVAGLFALHPLHVESVAWVAERKDVLSTFFGLLALLSYARYARAKTATERGREVTVTAELWPGAGLGARSYWLALLLFGLGLLAKPMLVTLPFVMLLLDFWPLQRVENAGLKTFFTPQFGKLVLEKWPWFALAAASSAITLFAQNAAGAVIGAGHFPFFWRAVNAIESSFGYLQKAVWPADLAMFYPLERQRPFLPFLIASAVLVVVSAMALATIKRRPALLMGWLWYLGTLVPVIGLVQVGAQSMADRYTYIPLIGVFIALVWLGYDLVRRSLAGRVLGSAVATIILALFANRTVSQVRDWQNSLTLLSHATAVTHHNYLAFNNLGIALQDIGRNTEALQAYRTALQISPSSAIIHRNLGVLLLKLGNREEAMAHYSDAVRLSPEDAELQNFYGAALAAAGRNEEALVHYGEAVRLAPADAVYQNNLGVALGRAGRTEAAMERYGEAIRLRPDYAEAYNNLGSALTLRRRLEEAEGALNRALAIKPQYAEAHNNLGRVLALEGRPQEAVAQYRQALEINAGQPVIHYNLALALVTLGRLGEATEQLSEAVRLDPKSAEAQYELGRCLTESGPAEAAIGHLREAARLRPDWAEPLNALAWVLAMDGNAQVRDGAEAVRLAERAATLTEWKQPGILNTLAAAYAEAGRFDSATNAATQAIDLAAKSGRTNLIAQMQFALERYKQHRSLRQN